MDPNDPEVDATLLDHERADFGVALEASRARDLQPAGRHDVSSHEARDGHALAPDVRLDVSFRTDQKVAVGFDLTAEVAEHLSAALDLEPSTQHVIPGKHRRLWLEPIRLRPAVRTGNADGVPHQVDPCDP